MSPPPQAFYFGPAGRGLFGWLHRPSGERHWDVGVLTCNPFGYEALCTHRTLKHLAVATAAAGFPTLRFDYDGTGDSAGDDEDSGRVQAWIASITNGIQTLKAMTGVRRVCLVGLRLGVLLAALAAEERDDVAGLIAIAPVIKSRAYLRELRALALARPQAAPPKWAVVKPDIQEAAGFVFTAQTQQALADIDLCKLGRAPAPRVLILDRDDLPASPAWGEHLQTLGVAVERQPFAGYAAMTESAHESIVPPTMIAASLEWIGRLGPGEIPAIMADVPRQALEAGGVRESIVRPDTDSGLFGILTEPAAPAAPPKEAVLLLNSGAIPRVGPGRLYVTLARRLAREGAAVLRLDISGIGDSPPHAGEPENSVYTERAQQDIAASLHYLRGRFGAARYHSIGLCSGAYHGFKAAVSGAPFDTAVSINPLTFFWKEGMSLAEPEFHVAAESARYQSSALRLASWWKLLRGRADVRAMLSIFARRAVSLARHAAREAARQLRISVEDDLASELCKASQGGRSLYFIFGSGDPGLQLLREQGGSAVSRLMRRGKIELAIVPRADHTFTAEWSREHLIGLLAAHLSAP